MTTRKLISQSVGEKCPNRKEDVKDLQELLIAAGESLPGGADGVWGPNTAKAIATFQQKHPKLEKKPCVDPNDNLLLFAVWRAGLLIEMPGKSGIEGIKDMHNWFVKFNIGYDRSWARSIYGINGSLRYAVQRTADKEGNVHFLRGPVKMDCTTYVNLMLSIYMNGHIHAAPYRARCGEYGADASSHLARDRYQLPLIRRSDQGKSVNWHGDATHIEAATVAVPSGLYVLEQATLGVGKVEHMALLHKGTVYESTLGQSGSSCIARSLKDFTAAKKGKFFYLFGPSPIIR